ncbi:uncharacterized protein STEHIDRAFT_133723 [Stereum hirsutum FP-91666 SS1]|uniref:uncharacterized protein n=1 Tax=Stereum hirsutum (strain FP-91666) TaxID=721885 RepID=UPI0004449E61|nr:uncharacterized protein STEHIDRAFT_133723 [Stereum hirsutum FP-91666 SS1]EIM82926.1 hypothetical protein STEHIDRAFT_133723 [Stereum hirsutum FP-91666 SS1]
MPQDVPDSLDGWWCDAADEYAFGGFSYEVTACQTLDRLRANFSDIRNTFNSRYNTLGVHALIWFGFDGTDELISRCDTLFTTLHTIPKAKYVTRVVQFGSEPLYDDALSPDNLTAQILAAKANLSDLSIPVTVSELAYGYQERGGTQNVLDVIDSINIHMLPLFNSNASTANESWPIVYGDLEWFIEHGNGKKMYLTSIQNGWLSEIALTSQQPSSPNAVADIPNEQAYYQLLDDKCKYLKTVSGSGVGWFAHIYDDNMEPDYGIYNSSGALKFPFSPRTHC